MAKYTANVTGQSTTVFICNVIRRHDADFWFGTVFFSGTFGTTVTLQASPDGGVTKIPLKQTDGTAATTTALTTMNIQLGAGGTNSDALKIYAVTGAAGSPNVNIALFDNR